MEDKDKTIHAYIYVRTTYKIIKLPIYNRMPVVVTYSWEKWIYKYSCRRHSKKPVTNSSIFALSLFDSQLNQLDELTLWRLTLLCSFRASVFSADSAH